MQLFCVHLHLNWLFHLLLCYIKLDEIALSVSFILLNCHILTQLSFLCFTTIAVLQMCTHVQQIKLLLLKEKGAKWVSLPNYSDV